MTPLSARSGRRARARRITRDRAGLHRFVQTIGEEHPPLSLDAADLTINDPDQVRRRYGDVFTYLTRVELEVERNVLELRTLMPDATETDKLFYEDVWSPQELQHGVLLDAVQSRFGMTPAPMDLTKVTATIRLVGMLAHLPGMHGVIRLLYYMTGASTERSAVIAYSRLFEGLRSMGERAIAETVIAPIRRQEPSHFAFYKMSAEALVIGAEKLNDWQLQLARILRRKTYTNVGVNNRRQQADFGDVAHALEFDRDLPTVARQLGRVERELLWAKQQGLKVPEYVMKALEDAITRGASRRAGLES
jgi:hypothetical protein